jgi:hypothetical protein
LVALLIPKIRPAGNQISLTCRAALLLMRLVPLTTLHSTLL